MRMLCLCMDTEPGLILAGVGERTQVQSTDWENEACQGALRSTAPGFGGVGGCRFLLVLGYFFVLQF